MWDINLSKQIIKTFWQNTYITLEELALGHWANVTKLVCNSCAGNLLDLSGLATGTVNVEQKIWRLQKLFFFQSRSLSLCLQCLKLLVWCQEQEEQPASKNWVMRWWCGYLSGLRCRLLAYCPADAIASPNPIISCLIQIQTGSTFLVQAYPGCPEKKAVKRVY